MTGCIMSILIILAVDYKHLTRFESPFRCVHIFVFGTAWKILQKGGINLETKMLY